MGTYKGALRRARAEVVPRIPTLATELAEEPLAISNAVLKSLERQGYRRPCVAEADLNKATRHSISGWAISRQRSHLVSGTGREAQFLPEMVRYSTELWPDLNKAEKAPLFKLAISRMLNLGATTAQEEYTKGTDPEHRIWPQLDRTYAALGKRAMDLTEDVAWSVPLEGLSLYEAVRSHALETATEGHALFVSRYVKGDSADHLKAAHDLAYLPKAVSAHHIVGSMAVFDWWRRLHGEVVQSKNGAYVFEPDDRVAYAKIWQDAEEVADATLKCPARVEGVLDDYIHASINMMPEFNLL